MNLLMWVDADKETVRHRRNAGKRISAAVFERDLWPCHLVYKNDVFRHVRDGVLGKFTIISGEGDMRKKEVRLRVLKEAMAHIRPLLDSCKSRRSEHGEPVKNKRAIPENNIEKRKKRRDPAPDEFDDFVLK